MENVEFTDEEIREQLANLGYFEVSEAKLEQFRQDLQRLVERDRSSASSSWYTGLSSPSLQSDTSPVNHPLYPKRSPASKPTFSRYQPHIPTSPRETRPKEHNLHDESPLMGAAHPTPETQLKKLSLTDSSPEPVHKKFSPNRQRFGFSEDRELSSGHPTTSLRCDDVTDDVIPQYRILNKTDETTNSLRHHYDITDPHSRFRSDVTPETPSMEGESSEPPSSMERRIIRKRKVMRKQDNGESAIFDESLVAEGDLSYRMHDVSVDDMSINYDRVHMPPTLPPRPHTARPSTRRAQDLESIQEQPLPSYIRPNTSHPHTRNLRKTDPVNRYHQYRDAWNAIKAPGERSHSALRWEVKAQMMYKDEPQPRAQRVFVPNNYVVPTSKKRSALRWEVRHAMERGLPVPSTFTVM